MAVTKMTGEIPVPETVIGDVDIVNSVICPASVFPKMSESLHSYVLKKDSIRGI
jgi:hypothetical protein